jgi:hypothetical protein
MDEVLDRIESFLYSMSKPAEPPLFPSPLPHPVSTATKTKDKKKQITADEAGKRSARLAIKSTAGCTTMEKVRFVLLKKSGIIEEAATPQAADLQRYQMCYKKPLTPGDLARGEWSWKQDQAGGDGPRCGLTPPPWQRRCSPLVSPCISFPSVVRAGSPLFLVFVVASVGRWQIVLHLLCLLWCL